MSRTKTENWYAGFQAGYQTRWVHNGGGLTTTIAPRAGETVVLASIELNTAPASAIQIADSVSGQIANIKGSVAEKDFHYNLPLKQGSSLTVLNPSGGDITIVFGNY